MRYDQNWEELGRSIQDAVDWAVNSRNYHHLNRTIRQVVETAVDLGGEAIRRSRETVTQTTETVTQTVTNAVAIRHLYGSTGGTMAKGVLKTVFGGILAAVSGLGLMGAAMLEVLLAEYAAPIVILIVGLAGGGLMIGSGVKNIGMVNRFKAYRRLLGSKTTCAIEKLARSVGKTAEYVRNDLHRMFGRGFFLEGHLDKEQTMLITSDDTYKQFEQARLQLEQTRKEQQVRQSAEKVDRQLQEVLDRGNAFVAQIRKCNDDIPGEAVSAKISRMELIVQKIFDRARSHPEIVPDLKKMMDYYLPMTVKLLTAYADMDAQPIQGSNIEKSKLEIEDTLDTLNLAFEKLLDQIFQETALDVSSDISVLQTLLAQEGLAEDDITKLRNNR